MQRIGSGMTSGKAGVVNNWLAAEVGKYMTSHSEFGLGDDECQHRATIDDVRNGQMVPCAVIAADVK